MCEIEARMAMGAGGPHPTHLAFFKSVMGLESCSFLDFFKTSFFIFIFHIYIYIYNLIIIDIKLSAKAVCCYFCFLSSCCGAFFIIAYEFCHDIDLNNS